MTEFLYSPGAQAVFWSAILAALLVSGFYLIQKARGMRRSTTPNASDLLTDFRNLHDRGQLSDQEFRDIKTMLGKKMQRELLNDGDEG